MLGMQSLLGGKAHQPYGIDLPRDLSAGENNPAIPPGGIFLPGISIPLSYAKGPAPHKTLRKARISWGTGPSPTVARD